MKILRTGGVAAASALLLASLAVGATAPAVAADPPDTTPTSPIDWWPFWVRNAWYAPGDRVAWSSTKWAEDAKLYRALEWNHNTTPADPRSWALIGDPSEDPDKNLAREATVSASSEFDGRYGASKAVDGIVGTSGSGEWASAGDLTPYIRLEWSSSQTIDEIRLSDRPNGTDWTRSGTLHMSDGSKIFVDFLENNGASRTISFLPRHVTWVVFTVDEGYGANNGLSEIEVYHRGT